MTADRLRQVRAGLVGLVAALAAAVFFSLRRPPEAATPTPSPGPIATGQPATRTDQLEWRGFDGERESWVLRAQSMRGSEQEEQHLDGVVLTFSYSARGEIRQSTIRADRCVYTPNLQKAVFQGHVVLVSPDGLELATDSLVYRGDKGVAKTDQPLTFRRKDVSGSATGLHYDAEAGVLELESEVVVRIQDEDAPPTHIRSQRAVLEREAGLLHFYGSVVVRQEEDVLQAGRLSLTFSEDSRAVYRALAVEDVEVRTRTGRVFPGVEGAATAGGPRHLKCRKLDVWFGPDRKLHEVTAGPDADLLLLPATGEPAERRRARARFLIFRFDDQGRLYELQGQREVSFMAEPLGRAKGERRTLSCENVVARFDPATGASKVFDFQNDVVFTRGRTRATAGVAWYDGPQSLLIMKDAPRLLDPDQATELTATAIDLGTETGDIAARHDVRYVMRGTAGGGRGMLGGSAQAPALLGCRYFDYQASARKAQCRDNALLRSGSDEVRAGEITIAEPAAGRRRLLAEGDVSSLMQPAAEPGRPPAERITARAQRMAYEEAERQIVYTGDVVIRQGDILTRSPKATLSLNADATQMRELVAGEPVEVRQGARVASGRRGTYTPADQTMVLVGDQVVLRDPDQTVSGRSLTFRVGGDTILVDGQEMVRTETIIRNRKPPSP